VDGAMDRQIHRQKDRDRPTMAMWVDLWILISSTLSLRFYGENHIKEPEQILGQKMETNRNSSPPRAKQQHLGKIWFKLSKGKVGYH
jgi:hypothetical protein